MSSWSDERRRNQAAEAEQRRLDQDAAAERVLKMRAAEDERRRANKKADKAEARAEKQQKRRDKRDRRRERAQAWAKNTTPGIVYRRGTLALVTASALASLPAQIMHFATISLMLLPLPFALEGAAWVMAAGVAYADERKLPAWVRWLLRALCLSAAGFAAWINFDYGSHKGAAVGYGLAAVTLLGPLFFEVRQWVTTLSFDAGERKRLTDEKARAKHEKRRRKDHKAVVKLAKKLVSAAPYGALTFEDAFASAWEIKYGTRTPGMTPALHAEQLASSKALTEAMDAANGSPVSVRSRLLEVLHPAPVKALGVTKDGAEKAPTGGSFEVPSKVKFPQVVQQMPTRPGRGHAGGPKVRGVRRAGDTTSYSEGARKQAAIAAKSSAPKPVNGTARSAR